MSASDQMLKKAQMDEDHKEHTTSAFALSSFVFHKHYVINIAGFELALAS